MDGNAKPTGMRQQLLNSNKTERIIVAVSPELKAAVANLANTRCVSMSSLITSMLADEVIDSLDSQAGG
ncbi:hypothetical protein [Xiamenia xianingshaonis]|nr:hypothetical protein [Xiamenia xianingshaonis]